MATFARYEPKPDPGIKQDASSDPESLLEDMRERAEAHCIAETTPYEWTGTVDRESLPSNPYGGLEPDW